MYICIYVYIHIYIYIYIERERDWAKQGEAPRQRDRRVLSTHPLPTK